MNFIKNIWYKLTKGYTEKELHSLDIVIAKRILPILIYIKQHKIIAPKPFYDDKYIKSLMSKKTARNLLSYCKRHNILLPGELLWGIILDKIIQSFQLIIQAETRLLTKEEKYQIKGGIYLFAEHYEYLYL